MKRTPELFDECAKDAAPSPELRRWYGHDPAKLAEFADRYRAELEQHPARGAVAHLAELSGRAPLTLLTATRQVARLLAGEPLARFRYHDKGMMAVLGRGDAVAELPLLLGAGTSNRYRLRFGGSPAWLLWVGVHIAYLICFSNRVKVLVDWGWSYFTSRGAGAILVRLPDEQVLTLAPERAEARVDVTSSSNGGAVGSWPVVGGRLT